MGVDEMRRIGGWMLEVLSNPEDGDVRAKVRGEVREMCEQFPVPCDRVMTKSE